MSQYLPYFILLPLVGLAISALFPNRNEQAVFGVSIVAVGIHALGVISLSVIWLVAGCPVVFFKGLTLYQTHDSHFSIDFYFVDPLRKKFKKFVFKFTLFLNSNWCPNFNN